MKKILSVIAVMVSAAMTSTLVQAGTIANNGQLSITGQINPMPPTTCTMEITSSGSAVTTLNLLPVTIDTFSKMDSATDFVGFNLRFINWPPAMVDNSSAQLTLNGTPDTNNNNVFMNMTNTDGGGATGIAIQIQETTNAASNMVPGTLNSETYSVTGGSFNVPLQANIVRTSQEAIPVVQGTVTATPIVQIDYN